MNSPSRLHAFDAARAFALLAGVVLHATMSFFLPIPTSDVSQSPLLAVLFYAIHPWRMALFFLIAGFLARTAFHRRGLRSFVADRAKRIALPFIGGWLLLVPATIAIVLWGLSRSPAPSQPEEPPATGLPLSHLWFLYYLLLVYAAALLGRGAIVGLADRRGRLRAVADRGLEFALRYELTPFFLAVPVAALLYADPSWPVWFGIPTPDTGLAPRATPLVAFGGAFGLGWLLARRREGLVEIERRWAPRLVAAAALTAAALALAGATPDLAAPTKLPGADGARALYASLYALSIGFWVLGILGAALRFARRESASVRYLADASYWVYLVHLPIVFALQVALRDLPISWAVKFPLIVGATLGLLLIVYDLAVRSTLLGEWLQGRRLPRKLLARPDSAALQPQSTTSATPAPRNPAELGASPALATLEGAVKRYGKATALAGVDLAVQPGELLAVLGPNGAGKSTAIGLWLGTLAADAGQVTLFGGAPAEVESRLALGVMMQEVALAPTLTVREQVELAAAAYRSPLPTAEALAQAGLTPLASKRYGALSGGQKRQVQFAVAICGRPRLLVLDEPSVGLDIAAREAMWRSIRALRDRGTAIVLTTHYLEEAEALADRVVVLARGRLVASGTVAEMRALVARRQIRCLSALPLDEIRTWPEVVEATREGERLSLTASDAERVVRRLLDADPALSSLEVRQASLAEAFSELVQEAA